MTIITQLSRFYMKLSKKIIKRARIKTVRNVDAVSIILY